MFSHLASGGIKWSGQGRYPPESTSGFRRSISASTAFWSRAKTFLSTPPTPLSQLPCFFRNDPILPFHVPTSIGNIVFTPLSIKMPASRLAELAGKDEVSWIEEGSRIKGPANCDSARLSNVDHVQSDEYALDGYGVSIGQWDGGAVDNSHPDLSDQVSIHTGMGISSHATGVAGTLVGKGGCDKSGMAREASLHSFDFDGDVGHYDSSSW